MTLTTTRRVAAPTAYERNQQFNALTRWLHSFRYRTILRVIRDLRVSDRPLRVLEIGAATGRLFDVLDARFAIDYTGI